MSTVNPDGLKSASDTTIPFLSRPETIGLVQIRHDTLIEFAKITKTVKIVNNDAVNSVTYRLQSPSAPLRTVPPNSDETIDEWTSYVEINPDPVTGQGTIEMDLVSPKDARLPNVNRKQELELNGL